MSARAHRCGSILLTGGALGVAPSGNFLTLSIGKAGVRAAVWDLHAQPKERWTFETSYR